MTIKQLEYFSTTAKLLSFSKAAEQLYVSQPALSRSILALEEEIGVALFDRNKHNVSLTPAGIVLAAKLPKLSVDLSEIIAEVQQVHSGKLGTMRIAIQNGLAIPSSIRNALQYFTRPESNAEVLPVCLDPDDIIRSIQEGKIEIACTSEEMIPPGMYFEGMELYSDSACIAHQHTLYQPNLEGDSLIDYRSASFICSGSESSPSLQFLRELCISRGFFPKITLVKDSSTQFFCVENGLGIGLFPAHHKIFESGKITCVQLNDVPAFTCRLQWSPKTSNPVISLFVDAVRHELETS